MRKLMRTLPAPAGGVLPAGRMRVARAHQEEAAFEGFKALAEAFSVEEAKARMLQERE